MTRNTSCGDVLWPTYRVFEFWSCQTNQKKTTHTSLAVGMFGWQLDIGRRAPLSRCIKVCSRDIDCRNLHTLLGLRVAATCPARKIRRSHRDDGSQSFEERRWRKSSSRILLRASSSSDLTRLPRSNTPMADSKRPRAIKSYWPPNGP